MAPEALPDLVLRVWLRLYVQLCMYLLSPCGRITEHPNLPHPSVQNTTNAPAPLTGIALGSLKMDMAVLML
jgi:hypothetical protein